MTPEWHWTLKCQRYPMHMLQLPQVPNFTLLHSKRTASHFWVTGQFEISAPNDPKMILNTKRPRHPIYMWQVPPSPNFHSILLFSQSFSSYRPFWYKCTKWPKVTFNSKRSKLPHVHNIPTPEPNFTLFPYTITRVWDIGNWFFHLGTMVNFNHFSFKV